MLLFHSSNAIAQLAYKFSIGCERLALGWKLFMKLTHGGGWIGPVIQYIVSTYISWTFTPPSAMLKCCKAEKMYKSKLKLPKNYNFVCCNHLGQGWQSQCPLPEVEKCPLRFYLGTLSLARMHVSGQHIYTEFGKKNHTVIWPLTSFHSKTTLHHHIHQTWV